MAELTPKHLRDLADGLANQNSAAECIAQMMGASKDMLAILKEWDEPGACGCETATCTEGCLPARTRAVIAKATGETL